MTPLVTLLEPGVFWSDVVLGALALALGVWLLRRGKRWWRPFLPLALGTWTGALYHGLVNTTERLSGELLWTATLLLLALVSVLFADDLLWRRRAWRVPLGVLWAAYAVFVVFVSEEFLWALVIQGVIVLSLGAWFVATRRSSWPAPHFLATLGLYLGFLALDALAVVWQQGGVTLGLPMSHNTLFHFVQMPALVLLALFLDRVDDDRA